MCSERHPVRVQEADRHSFMPDPLVSIPSPVTIDKISAEWHLREEQDHAARLQHAPVLLPQRIKWERDVPCVLRCAVWQIREDHID